MTVTVELELSAPMLARHQQQSSKAIQPRRSAAALDTRMTFDISTSSVFANDLPSATAENDSACSVHQLFCLPRREMPHQRSQSRANCTENRSGRWFGGKAQELTTRGISCRPSTGEADAEPRCRADPRRRGTGVRALQEYTADFRPRNIVLFLLPANQLQIVRRDGPEIPCNVRLAVKFHPDFVVRLKLFPLVPVSPGIGRLPGNGAEAERQPHESDCAYSNSRHRYSFLFWISVAYGRISMAVQCWSRPLPAKYPTATPAAATPTNAAAPIPTECFWLQGPKSGRQWL